MGGTALGGGEMNRISKLLHTRWIPVAGTLLLLVAFGSPASIGRQVSLPGSHPSVAYADSGCQLQSAGGAIQHVIYVQFDNVHFMRDNPNVPSDLEQMPHLLNFIEHNGAMLTNHHTPLI